MTQLGLAVDHDSSGLVFSPLANVEVGGLQHAWKLVALLLLGLFTAGRGMPGRGSLLWCAPVAHHGLVLSPFFRVHVETSSGDRGLHSHAQVDNAAFSVNEAILERLLAVDDVDAVHTNCAGLQN